MSRSPIVRGLARLLTPAASGNSLLATISKRLKVLSYALASSVTTNASNKTVRRSSGNRARACAFATVAEAMRSRVRRHVHDVGQAGGEQPHLIKPDDSATDTTGSSAPSRIPGVSPAPPPIAPQIIPLRAIIGVIAV